MGKDGDGQRHGEVLNDFATLSRFGAAVLNHTSETCFTHRSVQETRTVADDVAVVDDVGLNVLSYRTVADDVAVVDDVGLNVLSYRTVADDVAVVDDVGLNVLRSTTVGSHATVLNCTLTICWARTHSCSFIV